MSGSGSYDGNVQNPGVSKVHTYSHCRLDDSIKMTEWPVDMDQGASGEEEHLRAKRFVPMCTAQGAHTCDASSNSFSA